MAELKRPVNARYYRPVEKPIRYPLELRLTDAEREAVETSFDAMQYAADELGLSQADCDRLTATLRGLLERLK